MKAWHDPDFETTIRAQAARTVVDLFDSLYEGAFAVDLDARVVWMNDKFKALLGWNGTEPVEGLPIEEIVPNSQMRRVIETGQAALLDIIVLGDRHLVVSRIPLTDDRGRLTGAMGMILYDRLQALKPLVTRFQAMQRDLVDARRALARGRGAKYGLANFVGASAPVLALKRQARRAAERDAPVLLLGETGTGKELLAHAIHAASARASGPMVRINVAAIPETLVESALFGTAAHAFTGSDRKERDGKFQLADGGTLFLDEIGDLPLALQPKLLRALEDQEIERLGSNQVTPVDVRVIAATSRDLKRMVEDGSFRADLYYRLNVLPLHLPPLRERLEDLPLLADTMLDDMRDQAGFGPRDIDAAALGLLAAYHWPGNVRELRNILEQAATRAEGAETLTAEHFAGLMADERGHRDSAEISTAIVETGANAVRPLREVLADAERAAISRALDAAGGVKLQAAKLLGISRAQFYEKLASLERSGPGSAAPGGVKPAGWGRGGRRNV